MILRHNHAFCLNEACTIATNLGFNKISVIEFGVSTGGGLMNICKICNKLSSIYNIEIDIYGFDSGVGMPPPLDYRDHPELYQEGDFRMEKEKLLKKLPSNCKL